MARVPVKIFQDPIYGPISVASPLVLRLIDSRAMQRLKHIRQLGTSYFTFLGAEHSRFSHSLGCLHLMGQALDHLEKQEGLGFSSRAREIAQVAALLHDIGHCAFSHTLEGVLGYDHEDMTVRLVTEEPELRSILGPARFKVAALISGRGLDRETSVLRDLISSQLDVDRLDYLVRDAHYTGVDSGRVDVSRILGNFTVHAGKLVVRDKGFLAVEEYFLARYFMYWKVYFHKTSRCLELVLKGLLRRARELHGRRRLDARSLTPALRAFFEQATRVPFRAFLDHDDTDVMVAIKAWQYSPDPVLSDLCSRFLTRRKFKLLREAGSLEETLSRTQVERIKDFLESRCAGSSEYYFIEDRFGNLPYDVKQPVYLLDARGNTRDLLDYSGLISSVTKRLVHARYYVPHEYAAAVGKLL